MVVWRVLFEGRHSWFGWTVCVVNWSVSVNSFATLDAQTDYNQNYGHNQSVPSYFNSRAPKIVAARSEI